MRALGMLAAALALAAAGCGGEDEEEAATTERETPATTTEARAAGCTDVEQPAAKSDGGRKAPAAKLDPSKTHRVRLKTNCGSFTIELDPESAPKTAASLVSLARTGFFDDTVFHRIVPGFVIQGGDPTATGAGGPGYQTRDVPPPGARYTKGVVAMAKTPTEPLGTAGSQFFVVTGEDIGLPAEYAIVGKVTDGLEVVERIGRLGDEAERPTQPVVIDSVEVEES